MNGKDITNVNKIMTRDLDVNHNIDMKNRQIKNVGDGNENAGAVNVKQFNEVETQVIAVNNKVTKNNTDIATIHTNNGYYYFTNHLKHDNVKTVKFPAVNKHPYSANNDSELFRITLDGHYHVIYTDNMKVIGKFTINNQIKFIIHDDTNGIDLFVIRLENQSG